MHDGKVIQLRFPQEAENQWEVTIEVKPRIAFLRAVLLSMLTRRPIRIHHTFTNDPRTRLKSPATDTSSQQLKT